MVGQARLNKLESRGSGPSESGIGDTEELLHCGNIDECLAEGTRTAGHGKSRNVPRIEGHERRGPPVRECPGWRPTWNALEPKGPVAALWEHYCLLPASLGGLALSVASRAEGSF